MKDILIQFSWWMPLNVIICGLLIAHFVIKSVVKRLSSIVLMNTHFRPLQCLLWIMGLSLILLFYGDDLLAQDLVLNIKNMLRVAGVVVIAWAAFGISREMERIFLKKQHYDKTSVELFSKLSAITITMLTLLMILPLFGFQIAGLLAFGGFGGIIVGMAAKDVMANILGGIVIAIDKPFKIGEWIHSVDQNIEGIVEHI